LFESKLEGTNACGVYVLCFSHSCKWHEK